MLWLFKQIKKTIGLLSSLHLFIFVKNLTFSGLIGMVCQPILTIESHKYTLILMFDLHWLQCPLDRAVSARNEQHILQPDFFLHTIGWFMIFKFHLLSMSHIIMKHCQKATTISHWMWEIDIRTSYSNKIIMTIQKIGIERI